MGMPPTKLYSLPHVCEAAKSLLAVHDSLQGDEIPIEATHFTVRPLIHMAAS